MLADDMRNVVYTEHMPVVLPAVAGRAPAVMSKDGIHPQKNQDRFPITNVGNDGEDRSWWEQ
ncbi:MAG: hypothetical protein V3T42_02030 [Nitrospirales bacterium]